MVVQAGGRDLQPLPEKPREAQNRKGRMRTEYSSLIEHQRKRIYAIAVRMDSDKLHEAADFCVSESESGGNLSKSGKHLDGFSIEQLAKRNPVHAYKANVHRINRKFNGLVCDTLKNMSKKHDILALSLLGNDGTGSVIAVFIGSDKSIAKRLGSIRPGKPIIWNGVAMRRRKP